MKPTAPWSSNIAYVDRTVSGRNLQEVTSHMMYSPSSTQFDPAGLYSEEIFGELGTEKRYTQCAYISVNTQLIQPLIYVTLVQLKRLYSGIMAGTAYAVFDTDEKDFVPAEKTDEGANTGFSFFLKYLPDIQFKKNESGKRSMRIDLIEKYRNNLTTDKVIVAPAGIRDAVEKDGYMQVEEINKYYASLMKLSRGIPKNNTSQVFDHLKWQCQTKLNAIYEYLMNIIKGKTGYMQSHYTSRTITLSSRNTISPASSKARRPDDPQFIKSNETGVPLFQAASVIKPVLFNHMNSAFMDHVFVGTSGGEVPLINKKTLKLEYVQVGEDERKKFTTTDGVEGIVNRFKNHEFRARSVDIKGKDKKWYYLYLIYRHGDDVYLFRNKDEFISQHGEKLGVDESQIRSITYLELIYLVTYTACHGKHAFVTRYPVLHSENIYTTKIHLLSTEKSDTVTVKPTYGPAEFTVPRFPRLQVPYIDSQHVHIVRLTNLNADFDGDQCTTTILLTKEANAEQEAYMNSKEALITASRKLLVNIGMYTNKLALYNLSKMDGVDELAA